MKQTLKPKPQSLYVIDTNNVPEILHVHTILTNGEISAATKAVSFVKMYMNRWPMYELISGKCRCCNHNLGVIILLDGKSIFQCFSFSCLERILAYSKKLETTP